jgi:hypothetical protein
MQRTRNYILAILGVFVLFSCAQVGTITGGFKDVKAPQPIKNKVSPLMASTNVKPAKIYIPFDEFIKLNNPSQNIVVTPNTLTVDASIVRKTLVLKLEGEYLPNTTYSILFNRAIQDITEQNDSLFYYVFSTGSVIDNYKAKFLINDGFTNKPRPEITVGLFKNEISLDTTIYPIYTSESDQNGHVKFNYLKAENYYVYAYDDLNKNGTIDLGEDAGRLLNPFAVIDTVFTDTIKDLPAISVTKQKQLSKLKTTFEPPSLWKIYNTQAIDTAQLKFTLKQPLKVDISEEKDTLFAYFDLNNTNKLALVYLQDTLTKRVGTNSTNELKLTTNLDKKELPFGENLELNFNDVLKAYTQSKIVINGKPITKDTSLNFKKADKCTLV